MATPNRLRIVTADNDEIEVQTTLEDRLAFEQALRKNKSWGKLEDNSLKMLPFMAWNAAKRTGKTTLTWAEFTTGDTSALTVEPIEDDEEDEDLEVEAVGKDTPPTHSTTSPWSSPESSAEHLGNGEESPAHA